MKSKLGIFSNANALLVGFSFTHKELITVQSVSPEALEIREKEENNNHSKLVFSLVNASNTGLGTKTASFPFFHEDETKKVEVLFTVQGADTESIKYNASAKLPYLRKIEEQITNAMDKIKKTAAEIEILNFDTGTKSESTEEEE